MRTVRAQVVVAVEENSGVDDDVGRAARLSSSGINNVDDGGDVGGVGRGGGEERMGAGLGPDPVDVATPIPAPTKSHHPKPTTAGPAPLASVHDHLPTTPARNIAGDQRPARSIPPPSEQEPCPPDWLDEVLNAGQRAVGPGDDQLVDGDDDVDASDQERNLPFAASSSISANRDPESWPFKLGDSTRFDDDDDGGDHEERCDGDDDAAVDYTDDEDRDVTETRSPGLGSTVLGEESQEQLNKLTVFFQQGDADADREDEHEATPSLYENNISSTSTSTEQPSTDRFRTISVEPAPTRPEYEHTPLDNVAGTGSSERIAGSHASEDELPRETPEMESNESDFERSSPWPKTPIKEESQQSTTDELLEEFNEDESPRSTPWPNTPVKEESQASIPISAEAPEDASSDCEVQLSSPWPNTPIKEESQASLPISQELPYEANDESSEDEFLSGPWPKTPVKQETSQTAILQSTLEDESTEPTRWSAHTPIKAEACESQINISLQLIDSFPAPSATVSAAHTPSPTPETPPRTAHTIRRRRFIPREISDPEDQPPPRRRRLHRRASIEISSPTTPTFTTRPSQGDSSPYLAPATQLKPKPRAPTPLPGPYHASSSDIDMTTPPPPSRRRRILRSSLASSTPSYTDRLLSTYSFRPAFPTPAYALLECLTPSELHYELLRLNKYWTLHADDSEIPPTDLEFPDETYDPLWRAAQDLAGLWCASVLEREMPVEDITWEEFRRLEDEKRVFGRWRDKMMVVLGKELRLSTNNWGIKVLGLRKDRKVRVGTHE